MKSNVWDKWVSQSINRYNDYLSVAQDDKDIALAFEGLMVELEGIVSKMKLICVMAKIAKFNEKSFCNRPVAAVE